MEEENRPISPEEKAQHALLQVLIRVAALEKVLLDKKIITDNELAGALAQAVSDVVETAKKQLNDLNGRENA